MGLACPYAHSIDELKAAPDLSKTKLCASRLWTIRRQAKLLVLLIPPKVNFFKKKC